MLPNRLVAALYLRRGVQLWLLARVAASGVLLLAREDPLRLSVLTIGGVLLVSVALGFVDVHRQHERDLLANLAVRRRTLVWYLLIPAVLGEWIIAGLVGTT